MMALVIGIYFMEAVQTILTLVDAFRWFGSDWGNMAQLNNLGMVWFTLVVWGPLSTSLLSDPYMIINVTLTVCSCLRRPNILRMENLDPL
jgi:hypothetical protein